LAYPPHDPRLVRQRAAAQRGGAEVPPLEEQRTQVDLGAAPAQQADDRQPAVAGEDREVAGEVRGADDVQDHVRATTTRSLLCGRYKVLCGVIDGHLRTERLQGGVLAGSGGGDHPGTQRGGELDRERADAAAAA